jgi:hypothetical protein
MSLLCVSVILTAFVHLVRTNTQPSFFSQFNAFNCFSTVDESDLNIQVNDDGLQLLQHHSMLSCRHPGCDSFTGLNHGIATDHWRQNDFVNIGCRSF